MNYTAKIAGNYEKYPVKTLAGFDGHAWEGAAALSEVLRRALENRGGRVLVFELYPGVEKADIEAIFLPMQPALVLDSDEWTWEGERLRAALDPGLPEDPVFGVRREDDLALCFDPEKIAAARRQLEAADGLTVVYGVGASLLTTGDVLVQCSLARWEAQLRLRAGQPNWKCDNADAPILQKVKVGYFVLWRMADRQKTALRERVDFLLDCNDRQTPRMMTGEAYRAALAAFVTAPFRLKPYFDPGVWGGEWMRTHFDLPKEAPNFAWSFDGVPEENSLLVRAGDVTLEIPALDVVLAHPKALLGERVFARFGAEFPIRFDLLDTMQGQNLSLQVHPLRDYIHSQFHMSYTQDESYYILDAGEGSCVYLGVKEGVDRAEMLAALRTAQAGGAPFDAEKYVNRFPAKKHDHFSIPAGTVHCSGANTMVLEISATPYIFTFKLWDWGRLGLDGKPRPIHIDHGEKNIQWQRDTAWVRDQLVDRTQLLSASPGLTVERTGLHPLEFIETLRHTGTAPALHETQDSVHVLNLVDGDAALVESPDGAFEPFEVHYAETFILPAAVQRYTIRPLQDGQSISTICASIRP